jgi:hypothetical protein
MFTGELYDEVDWNDRFSKTISVCAIYLIRGRLWSWYGFKASARFARCFYVYIQYR